MKNNAITKLLAAACAVLLLAAAFHWLPLARAEQYHVGDGEIRDAIRELNINWTSGTVHIAYHSGSAILISEKTTGVISDDMRMRWRVEGDTLRIEYEQPGFHLFSVIPHEKELTVTLPETLTLEKAKISATSGVLDIPLLYADSLTLGVTSGEIRAAVNARRVKATLTSGSLDMRMLSAAEEIKLEATSGDVVLSSDFEADKVELGSTSGRIRAEVKQAGEFKADSTSGGVSALLGSVKKASFKSTSGTVAVDIIRLGSLEIRTTSGDVALRLPASQGFAARIETTSGDFDHNLPLTRDGKTYVAGDGSGEVEIRTTSGDIRITAVEN